MKTNGLTLLIIVAFSIILNAEEDQSLPKVKHMIDTHISTTPQEKEEYLGRRKMIKFYINLISLKNFKLYLSRQV